MPKHRRSAPIKSSVLSPEQKFINALFDIHSPVRLDRAALLNMENLSRIYVYGLAPFHALPKELQEDEGLTVGKVFTSFVNETLWTLVCIENEEVIDDFLKSRINFFIIQLATFYLTITHKKISVDFKEYLIKNIYNLIKYHFDREQIKKDFINFNLLGSKLNLLSYSTLMARYQANKEKFSYDLISIEISNLRDLIQKLYDQNHLYQKEEAVWQFSAHIDGALLEITFNKLPVGQIKLLKPIFDGQIPFSYTIDISKLCTRDNLSSIMKLYACYQQLVDGDKPFQLTDQEERAIVDTYDDMWKTLIATYCRETELADWQRLKQSTKILFSLMLLSLVGLTYAPLLTVCIGLLIIGSSYFLLRRYGDRLPRIIDLDTQAKLASDHQSLQDKYLCDDSGRLILSREGKPRLLTPSPLSHTAKGYLRPWQQTLCHFFEAAGRYRWEIDDSLPVSLETQDNERWQFPRAVLTSDPLPSYLETCEPATSKPLRFPRSDQRHQTSLATSSSASSSSAASYSSSCAASSQPEPRLPNWQQQGVLAYEGRSMAFFCLKDMPDGVQEAIQRACTDGYATFIASKREFNGFKRQGEAYKFKGIGNENRYFFHKTRDKITVADVNGMEKSVPVWAYQHTTTKH